MHILPARPEPVLALGRDRSSTSNDVLWGDSPNPILAAWDGADYIGDGSGADTIPPARWLCAIQNQSQNHRLTCAYN